MKRIGPLASLIAIVLFSSLASACQDVFTTPLLKGLARENTLDATTSNADLLTLGTQALDSGDALAAAQVLAELAPRLEDLPPADLPAALDEAANLAVLTTGIDDTVTSILSSIPADPSAMSPEEIAALMATLPPVTLSDDARAVFELLSEQDPATVDPSVSVMAGMAVVLSILPDIDTEDPAALENLTPAQTADLELAMTLLVNGSSGLSPDDPMFGTLNGLLGGFFGGPEA
jgi:hypothetical protein